MITQNDVARDEGEIMTASLLFFSSLLLLLVLAFFSVFLFLCLSFFNFYLFYESSLSTRMYEIIMQWIELIMGFLLA